MASVWACVCVSTHTHTRATESRCPQGWLAQASGGPPGTALSSGTPCRLRMTSVTEVQGARTGSLGREHPRGDLQEGQVSATGGGGWQAGGVRGTEAWTVRGGGIQRRGGSPPHSAQISEPSALRPMGRPASASSHPGGLTGHPVGLVNPSRCVLASTLLQEEPGFAAHSPCSGRHVTGGSSSPPWSSESSDPLLAALLGSAELCMCIAPSQCGLCALFTVMETHGTLLVKVWSTG